MKNVAVRQEDGKTAVESNESWTVIHIEMSSLTISAFTSKWPPYHCRTMPVSSSSLLFALFNWLVSSFVRENMINISFDETYDVNATHHSLNGVNLLPARQWMAKHV